MTARLENEWVAKTYGPSFEFWTLRCFFLQPALGQNASLRVELAEGGSFATWSTAAATTAHAADCEWEQFPDVTESARACSYY